MVENGRGVLLIIAGVAVVLFTWSSNFNSIKENPQNPDTPKLINWTLIGNVVALILGVVGGLLLIFGLAG